DVGEPLLAGVSVRLYGGGGAVDTTVVTDASGSFFFDPGNGDYLLSPEEPAEWRLSLVRHDGFPESTPGYELPVGQPRFAKIVNGIPALQSGSYHFAALGDSIAYNFNLCGSATGGFDYSNEVRDRLIAAAGPGTNILALSEEAIKGEHTDHLLIDEGTDDNNVFWVFDNLPNLVTISMVGNDLLDAEPGGSNPSQAEINRVAAELIDSRQNLQEAISSMLTRVPDLDVALNSLYDNLAWRCGPGDVTDLHREWIPILDQILREVAWGQIRRASINEVAAEFARLDQNVVCLGFDGLICRDTFQLDLIHPNGPGYQVIREKVWEGIGGVHLGNVAGGDPRTNIPGVDYGLLRRVRRLLPTQWETRNGAAVASGDSALDDQDGGATASVTLGVADEEFRLSGFPDWFDEIQIVKVIAGVSYRTTGVVTDDHYRIEASVTDQFRPPPGHAYVPTDWNFFTPIVGGGGPNAPAENPDYPAAQVLALPNVADLREVSASLTKNPVLPGGAGEYVWPPVTHEDLSTTTIRVAAASMNATPPNDSYQVELDSAWLDLYGWEKPRPVPVDNLLTERLANGDVEVSFDVVTDAQRYNLYLGRVQTLASGGGAGSGVYDHGETAPAGPFCDAATQDAGAGRLKIVLPAAQAPADDSYVLVTAHVDDVESPAGEDSAAVEIDRSQSICR
ncbi:MAG: GDSL-type esterase/lipase family protein, partial [Acidobacteriota bacterium]|nr:GDSL-type esterase/lipase family protein [Acidobacteriota bacterium]